MHGRRRHGETLLKVSFDRRSPVKLRVRGNVRQVLTLELGKRILFPVVRSHVQASVSRLTCQMSRARQRRHDTDNLARRLHLGVRRRKDGNHFARFAGVR